MLHPLSWLALLLPAAPAAASPCVPALASRSAGPASLQRPFLPPGDLPGYADALSTTSRGWPRLNHWCVWIEPATAADDPWQRRWLEAVQAALAQWAVLLPLERVEDPAAAQVRLWRRRPPLSTAGAGRFRASHGRALLSLVEVQRRGAAWRLEPAVEVLISPGQRRQALQATALHELGHAFGLWGHSSDAADALAAVPGPVPVLTPTARDRATLAWLQQQPTRFGRSLEPPP